MTVLSLQMEVILFRITEIVSFLGKVMINLILDNFILN